MILWISLILFSACMYMLMRNRWVFKNHRSRVYYNKDGTMEIELYEDYDTCMKKFWVWDFEKFRRVK